MKTFEKILDVLGEKIEALELDIRLKNYRIENLEKELKELKEGKKDE